MTDETNIIAFAPRAKVAPELHACELRLLGDSDFELTLFDVDDNVIDVIPLIAPDGFAYVAAWRKWRGLDAAISQENTNG
jgi:hypothetical protein